MDNSFLNQFIVLPLRTKYIREVLEYKKVMLAWGNVNPLWD